jgi:insertion element IS1 protein InsB
MLTKEGMGIRSTARVLQISPTTLLRRIIFIAQGIKQPLVSINKVYEVDEIRTFIKSKNKLIWIVYALERKSRNVSSFAVGSRTNKTLSLVLKTLYFSKPKTIYTDGLKNYRYLIDNKIHRVKQFGTNYIERKNLTLRTHLKRLNRRTLCFSRSMLVLFSVLKLYFWG